MMAALSAKKVPCAPETKRDEPKYRAKEEPQDEEDDDGSGPTETTNTSESLPSPRQYRFYKVVVSNGVCFRTMPDFGAINKDRAGVPTDTIVETQQLSPRDIEEIRYTVDEDGNRVLRHPNGSTELGWVKLNPSGYWLPTSIHGTRVLEPLKYPFPGGSQDEKQQKALFPGYGVTAPAIYSGMPKYTASVAQQDPPRMHQNRDFQEGQHFPYQQNYPRPRAYNLQQHTDLPQHDIRDQPSGQSSRQHAKRERVSSQQMDSENGTGVVKAPGSNGSSVSPDGTSSSTQVSFPNNRLKRQRDIPKKSKQPKTAYNFYQLAVREKVIAELRKQMATAASIDGRAVSHERLNQEVMRIIGKQWRDLDPLKRRHYHLMADQETRHQEGEEQVVKNGAVNLQTTLGDSPEYRDIARNLQTAVAPKRPGSSRSYRSPKVKSSAPSGSIPDVMKLSATSYSDGEATEDRHKQQRPKRSSNPPARLEMYNTDSDSRSRNRNRKHKPNPEDKRKEEKKSQSKLRQTLGVAKPSNTTTRNLDKNEKPRPRRNKRKEVELSSDEDTSEEKERVPKRGRQPTPIRPPLRARASPRSRNSAVAKKDSKRDVKTPRRAKRKQAEELLPCPKCNLNDRSIRNGWSRMQSPRGLGSSSSPLAKALSQAVGKTGRVQRFRCRRCNLDYRAVAPPGAPPPPAGAPKTFSITLAQLMLNGGIKKQRTKKASQSKSSSKSGSKSGSKPAGRSASAGPSKRATAQKKKVGKGIIKTPSRQARPPKPPRSAPAKAKTALNGRRSKRPREIPEEKQIDKAKKKVARSRAWRCDACTLMNGKDKLVCPACGQKKPRGTRTPGSPPSTSPALSTQKKEWKDKTRNSSGSKDKEKGKEESEVKAKSKAARVKIDKLSKERERRSSFSGRSRRRVGTDPGFEKGDKVQVKWCSTWYNVRLDGPIPSRKGYYSASVQNCRMDFHFSKIRIPSGGFVENTIAEREEPPPIVTAADLYRERAAEREKEKEEERLKRLKEEKEAEKAEREKAEKERAEKERAKKEKEEKERVLKEKAKKEKAKKNSRSRKRRNHLQSTTMTISGRYRGKDPGYEPGAKVQVKWCSTWYYAKLDGPIDNRRGYYSSTVQGSRMDFHFSKIRAAGDKFVEGKVAMREEPEQLLSASEILPSWRRGRRETKNVAANNEESEATNPGADDGAVGKITKTNCDDSKGDGDEKSERSVRNSSDDGLNAKREDVDEADGGDGGASNPTGENDSVPLKSKKNRDAGISSEPSKVNSTTKGDS